MAGCVRDGLALHRGALPAGELAVVRGIPVTSVERTLLDLSSVALPATLRRLVKRAEFLELTNVTALAAILERHPRRRGRGRLARLVDSYVLGAGKTRSEFEDRFLRFCARRGLPLPETNVVIDARGRPEVTWAQLHHDGDSVEADIRAALVTPDGDARRFTHAEGG